MTASKISAYAMVREKMVNLQRVLAKSSDVVMDGRDIGTVVLPNANPKIYLTASSRVRAERRAAELKAKGEPADLDIIEKDKIFLDENKIVGGIKTPSGIDRTIPISRHIKPILEHYMNNGKKYLFYNVRKSRYNYHNLQEAVRNEFSHTSHECRHTFSSNFYRTNVDRVTIKKIVGHKVKGDIR